MQDHGRAVGAGRQFQASQGVVTAPANPGQGPEGRSEGQSGLAAAAVEIGHVLFFAAAGFLREGPRAGGDGPGHDPTLDVQDQGRGVEVFATFQSEITARVQGQTDEAGLGQGQRLAKLEVFDFHGGRSVKFAGSGQGHFNGGRSGQHHVGVQTVIAQKGLALDVQDVFPHGQIGPQPAAEQGMGRGFGTKQAQTFGRGFDLAGFAVPGIGGQGHPPGETGEKPAQIHRAAENVDAAPQVVDQAGILVIAAQAGQIGRTAGMLIAGGLDKRGQQAVGTQFDQDASAGVQGLGGGGGKLNRAADVAPPVVGPKLSAGQNGAGDGGEKLSLSVPRRESGQPGHEPVMQGVHGRAVKGVFQVQAAADQPVLAHVRGQFVQRGDGTGQGDVAGAVDSGQAQRPGSDLGQFGGLLGAELGHGHAALAAGFGLQDAPDGDDPAGVFQAQGAGGVGGGHLADAMAQGHVRDHAPGGQGLGQANLQGKLQGLHHLDAIQTLRGRIAKQGGPDVEADQRGQGVLDPIQRRGGGLVAKQHVPAHARPGSPVAGKDEGQARSAAQDLAVDAARLSGLGGAAGRHIAQVPAQVVEIGFGQDQAVAEMVAAQGGAPGQTAIRRAVDALESPGPGGGQGGQAGRTVGRKQKRRQGLVGRRLGFDLLVWWDRGGLLQNDMGVGATETEGTDAGQARPGSGGQGGQPVRRDAQAQGVGVDILIQRGQVEIGRYGALLQYEQGLEQSRQPRGWFEVADIAFDRAHEQGRALGAQFAKNLADGAGFDGIAGGGAGSVGFQVADVAGIEIGRGVEAAHEFVLGLLVGIGDADGGAAVGVDAGLDDDPQNAIPLGQGVLKGLEQQGNAALGPDIAVGGGVKDLAAAVGGQHVGLGKTDKGQGRTQDVDPGGNGHPGFAAGKDLAGLVESHQGRGAGGIDGQAWPMDVEQVGNTVGQQAQGIADHGIGADDAGVVGTLHAGVQGRGADKDGGVGAGQGGGPDLGVFQGFPGQLQQQTLLGVHVFGFLFGNTKKGKIEIFNVIEHAGGERTGTARRAPLGMYKSLNIETFKGDLAYGIDAASQ